MGDVVTNLELWKTSGIVDVLMHYPLLNAFMTIMLMKIALRAVIDSDVIKHKVQFNTQTKHARSEYDSKGRRFAETFSLQGIDKWIRKRVVPDGSFEVDIENCYPSILLGICAEKRLRTPCLSAYVSNRRACMAEIGRDLRIKHDVAKELILVVMNGYSWWFHLCRIQGKERQQIGACKFLDDLQRELQSIRMFVKESADYKSVLGAIRDKKPELDEAKLATLAFAVMLEQKERKILDLVVTTCWTHFGFGVSTLLHDGFIASGATFSGDVIKVGNKLNEITFVESVLSSKCTADFGFNISIKVHPLITSN